MNSMKILFLRFETFRHYPYNYLFTIKISYYYSNIKIYMHFTIRRVNVVDRLLSLRTVKNLTVEAHSTSASYYLQQSRLSDAT